MPIKMGSEIVLVLIYSIITVLVNVIPWGPFVLIKILLFAVIFMAFAGLDWKGIMFNKAISGGIPVVVMGAAALFSGAVLTPVLLPFIPFRSFALKGWFVGLIMILLIFPFSGVHAPLMVLFSFLFFPCLSSFLALNFTGSTTFTGVSGVKKEMKIAIPAYMWVGAVSALLVLAQKGMEMYKSR